MARVSKKAGTYHHGDLRRVLIDAAIRVVEKDGVDALSLQALARKAGVSSGAPYHHFENRERLLGVISVEGFELLAAEMERCAAVAEVKARKGERGAARLRGIGRGYVSFALAHSGHFRIMFRSDLKQHLSAEQHAIVDKAYAMLIDAVALCQREGSVKAGDPRPMVLLAWSAVHGACTLWIDGPLRDQGLVTDAAELGDVIADTVVDAFAP